MGILNIVFLIIGFTAFFKGHIRVSKTKQISGKQAKIFGWMYIIAGALGFGTSTPATQNSPIISILTLGIYAAVILATIVLVVFAKGEKIEAEQQKTRSNFSLFRVISVVGLIVLIGVLAIYFFTK